MKYESDHWLRTRAYGRIADRREKREMAKAAELAAAAGPVEEEDTRPWNQ